MGWHLGRYLCSVEEGSCAGGRRGISKDVLAYQLGYEGVSFRSIEESRKMMYQNGLRIPRHGALHDTGSYCNSGDSVSFSGV